MRGVAILPHIPSMCPLVHRAQIDGPINITEGLIAVFHVPSRSRCHTRIVQYDSAYSNASVTVNLIGGSSYLGLKYDYLNSYYTNMCLHVGQKMEEYIDPPFIFPPSMTKSGPDRQPPRHGWARLPVKQDSAIHRFDLSRNFRSRIL